MGKETILVVDNEKEIVELIRIYLTNEGYETVSAGDGLEALDVLKSREVDLIILDIMMPRMDGVQACLEIRKEKNMPILMLSAKSEDMDKILGLTAGADDYLTKPFNPLELMARVKSQLRRYKRLNAPMPSETLSNRIELDDLIIDTATHEVHVEGRPVKLTPREFSILELLGRNRGIVFSTERIYETVWNTPYFESDNTVMVHIRKIREKVESNPRQPKYIKTVWGVGYKIET
ncbi:response regulator transcription factor [Paenibacillus chitinolyticus]|uniref:DNA-binding response regulator n=1 Tax=Paenibacillus chitinolyticus TaxID=79263 RepID=A0A410WSK5_9BACL|nr:MULTISPECIES: response regulator transcription factor [Paenibacillus]MCY9588797.1 response regulator transcription factor [Paenibacillus chitinolyticus]MCY9595699.1 response regulator transcription factor [Paenibacillus chitinolyticus]QAV17456.1 DNA-binding response regulator [Paenibacillus chitinolyticus]GKS10851.1 DNA-binding response regulator [Paenibacillus chitinolyticus]